MIQITKTKKAPAAIGPYSQALSAGSLLYASGQIPLDPESGEVCGRTIEEQTEQVMKNISSILEANSTAFEKVLKTTCFLTDMGCFAAFNEIYAKYFTGRPARSCVAVRELPKGVLCEVEFIAFLG